MKKIRTVFDMAQAGGRARAKKLTPRRRREIARKAGKASKGISGQRGKWRRPTSIYS